MIVLPRVFGVVLLIMLIPEFATVAIGGSDSKIRLEVVSPFVHVFQSTSVTDQKSPNIELWAAGNEYESAQIALHSDEMITVRAIRVSDLTGLSDQIITSDKAAIRVPEFVFLAKHTGKTPREELDGDVPGRYPDPLIEMKESFHFQGTSFTRFE